MSQVKGVPGDERVHIQVGRVRLECRVIADRWWYDSEILPSVAGQLNFFQTLTGKNRDFADFEGDKSLVKEEEYALIYGAVAYLIRRTALDPLDPVAAHPAQWHYLRRSYYEWQQNQAVVSRDNMLALEGGSSFRVSGAPAIVPEAQPGDGRHDNMRKFWKPVLVTGGRSVDFYVYNQIAGTPENDEYKLMIRLYGLHLIPVARVEPRAARR
jgi:hypothetical protein